MPVPSLAEASSTSSRGMARTFSSSSITTSGCADGRSILLMTGMITRFWREREVDVGERLRLDPLGGVDDQDGALAGLEAVAHLVGEVDVAGRVDEVEAVDQAVGGRVLDPDRARLDRDALLALEIHRIEDLAGHLPRIDRVGHLEEPVRERRLAVIDVGDDGEVAQARLGDRHREASVAHAVGRMVDRCRRPVIAAKRWGGTDESVKRPGRCIVEADAVDRLAKGGVMGIIPAAQPCPTSVVA